LQRRIGKYERLAYERQARELALASRPGGHPRGILWDPAAAERPVQFIEGFCRHHKAEWAGQLLRLEEWQKAGILRPVFGWMRADGTRRFRTAWIEIARKNGKALALDTPIPTPSGWTTMGEIRVGDAVFDERGVPCEVTFATETQNDRRCYRVSFSDGTSIVADGDHRWYTEARRNGLPRTGPKSSWAARHIRTTEQIRATLSVGKNGRTEWNHRVPCTLPLQIADLGLPIPPYTLGAWLGDGTASTAELTVGTDDHQILELIRAEGISAEEKASGRQAGSGVFLLGRGHLRRKLRTIGLLNNKHVPATYLRASVGQRLALLRGLMDTDGSASKDGQCEFSSSATARTRSSGRWAPTRRRRTVSTRTPR
jgi:hypothetical protein